MPRAKGTVLERLSALGLSEEEAWDVMAALRGPDQNTEISDAVKLRTTAVIRAAVGVPTDNPFGVTVSYGVPFEVKEKDQEDVSWHFVSHVIKAARALGLVPASTGELEPCKGKAVLKRGRDERGPILGVKRA